MVTVDLSRCSSLWISIRAHNQSLVQLLEPLTPRDVDVYPPETGRNKILEAAIEDADRHTDTSIFEFLIQHRQLPLRPLDLVKAAEDQTFSVLVQQLSLSTEDVAKMGPDILLGVWATDRRRIVDCLRRLVKQYHLDVNGRKVQEFVLTSRSVELVNAVVCMGLDVNPVFQS
ncbi:hypothetical protein VKT23_006582 [Stygiomarasmius scandens]|uniref:Calponin-homology (CH) domain-containing protein n=1 Tax=Marasmiellus scandens TaxID=2682957 RepID=A0ABR1JSK7_9AGAR